MTDLIEKKPSEVLREIMAKWPRKDVATDMEHLKSLFCRYVTTDFDYGNFSNRPFGEFSILSKELVIGNVAKLLVYDSANPQQPNLAILTRAEDGNWYLKKFLFQCASCFGTGILFDGDPCDTCGVTGWGLINWVKQKTDL